MEDRKRSKGKKKGNSSEIQITASCTGNHACDHVNTKSGPRNKDCREETNGVFAVACRHYHAINIVDIVDGGEKLSYALACFGSAIGERNSLTQIGYDIACSLEPYLKNVSSEDGFKQMIDKFCINYVIGSLHAYGHRSQCYYRYGPFWVPGTGFCKFEMVEWLWSRLQGFIGPIKNVCHVLLFNI